MKVVIYSTCLLDAKSHSCTTELVKPTPICLPAGAHLTLVIGPASSSTVRSSEVMLWEAYHKYIVLLRAIDKILVTL